MLPEDLFPPELLLGASVIGLVLYLLLNLFFPKGPPYA